MATTRKKRGHPTNIIPTRNSSSSEKNNNGLNVRNNKRDASQEPFTPTTVKKSKSTDDTTKNDDREEDEEEEKEVVQELPHTPTTTNGTDDDTTTKSTTTNATAIRRNATSGKTATTNGDNDTNNDIPLIMSSDDDDTTADLTTPTTTTATATASKKNDKKILPALAMKKDKHIAENSIRIITATPDTKNKQGGTHTLPLTPPASASASASVESPKKLIEEEDVSLKGYTDEEWFSLMGWHFSENKDHDFVDKHGRLYNYEDHFDRFEVVQDKIQSLLYDRLKNKYGFEQIAVAQNKSTSAPGGGDHHRFPQIFISPDARTNSTMLVLVPKVGEESPGQWDRDLFTSGEEGNFLFASQFPYIDMALEQGWGVVLCDPNGGDLHDSDEYREAHVQYVWDDIVQPSEATCVMYVAFGEGTDAVLSILDSTRAAEFRERVKAVVLLDGTTGDKRKEKLDRTWLNKHSRSFMAKNGASPGRNGTKVNAAEEHELVPGFALQAVFAFLRGQNGVFIKTQISAQSGSKSATKTNCSTNDSFNSSSVQKPGSTSSRDVRHDRRMMRLQSEKSNRINNNGINAMTNPKTTTSTARSITSSEVPRRGRGRPRKHG
ncbi:hypothetical protein F5H01DRAFT_350014 [Linnemannia elongata]|nr:hypothetical protein F5H01DRAFT_350014 [Linnemannia elongata]